MTVPRVMKEIIEVVAEVRVPQIQEQTVDVLKSISQVEGARTRRGADRR